MAPSDPPPVPPSHAPRATSYRGSEQTVIPITNEPAPPRTLQRNGSSSQGVQRKKSLVRPERERIDPNHRQYHYRQRAAEHASRDGAYSSSTTGNAPVYAAGAQEIGSSTAIQVPPHGPPPPPPPQRHRSLRDRVVPVRRGKSILGREEPDVSKDRATHHLPPTPIEPQASVPSPPEPVPNTLKKKPLPNDYDGKEPRKWPSCWYAYSLFVSCWIPNFMLRAFGKKEAPQQKAFREKIGLLSIILLICAAVGFLTFGFTQAVCPAPPLRFEVGFVNNGYLIINGWGYQLATWEHPAIPGQTNTSTNPLYPPINAGGMDASFLFQTVNQKCLNVITPKAGVNIGQNGNYVPTYFPCRLFNPNDTLAPSPTTYTNYSGCHLTSTARNQYYQFESSGVPNNKGGRDKGGQVYYTWEDLAAKPNFVAFNGYALNLNLLQSLPSQYFDTPANGLIQTLLASISAKTYSGQDITKMINSRRGPGDWEREAECLTDIIKVGAIDTDTIGCIASDIVLYCSLVVILAVIFIKFALAVLFGWFLSWRLGNFGEEKSYRDRMKRNAEIENWTEGIHEPAKGIRPRTITSISSMQEKRKSFLPQTSRFTQASPIHYTDRPSSPFLTPSSPAPVRTSSPQISPYRMSTSHTAPSITPPFSPSPRLSPFPGKTRDSVGSMFALMPFGSSQDSSTSDASSQSSSQCPFPLSKHAVSLPSPDYQPFGFPLIPTICLVTCYSEGEDGLRTTLDSIATTDYPNSHKIIVVICDGVITGHGNSQSTPDICVSMMRDLLIPKEQVEPFSYVAVADGIHKHNMAKIFAGFYKYEDATVDKRKQQRVPMITIVKCGSAAESKDRKPGNRGKRDSQVLLMSFLQKAMFDERMTTMEYELFNSFWRLTNISADKYEICLMVDADTKVYPDSLSRMVSCMAKDPTIAGLCGETKIGNKTDSWVTMIQVFEYYIAHHQSKAFESVFGGVTCLPGCFCMYRIKAPKGPSGYWVPILANPDVIERYQENVVDTLHKKNLLLLGEDRYLSTLMLSTFPNRKMMFCPQAVCKTVVPDTFRILLSQRRRWINSTVHNLFELVMVRDLCGTFCFSMQFIVFMDLVGTVALPAAISFTLYLIIRAIMGYPSVISLILLAMILGLPAVLIVMTSRKVIYVIWMFIYLISLPIWNFMLPVWAYWHFDDFTWGETRRVAGSGKDTHHGDKFGEFDSSQIVMKRWADFERERRRVKRSLQPAESFNTSDDSSGTIAATTTKS